MRTVADRNRRLAFPPFAVTNEVVARPADHFHVRAAIYVIGEVALETRDRIDAGRTQARPLGRPLRLQIRASAARPFRPMSYVSVDGQKERQVFGEAVQLGPTGRA